MTYTVFCQQVNQHGTIHIDTVTASGPDSAIQAGRRQCLADWNGGAAKTDALFTLEDIHCLGVAEGDVRIIHWQDQPD